MRIKIKKIYEYKIQNTDNVFENVFGMKIPVQSLRDTPINFHKNIISFCRSRDNVRFKNISIDNLSEIYTKANTTSMNLTQPNECYSILEMIKIGNYIDNKWNNLNIQFEVCYNVKANTLQCNCISITNNKKQELSNDFKEFFSSKFKNADELIINEKFCYGWWD